MGKPSNLDSNYVEGGLETVVARALDAERTEPVVVPEGISEELLLGLAGVAPLLIGNLSSVSLPVQVAAVRANPYAILGIVQNLYGGDASKVPTEVVFEVPFEVAAKLHLERNPLNYGEMSEDQFEFLIARDSRMIALLTEVNEADVVDVVRREREDGWEPGYQELDAFLNLVYDCGLDVSDVRPDEELLGRYTDRRIIQRTFPTEVRVALFAVSGYFGMSRSAGSRIPRGCEEKITLTKTDPDEVVCAALENGLVVANSGRALAPKFLRDDYRLAGLKGGYDGFVRPDDVEDLTDEELAVGAKNSVDGKGLLVKELLKRMEGMDIEERKEIVKICPFIVLEMDSVDPVLLNFGVREADLTWRIGVQDMRENRLGYLLETDLLIGVVKERIGLELTVSRYMPLPETPEEMRVYVNFLEHLVKEDQRHLRLLVALEEEADIERVIVAAIEAHGGDVLWKVPSGCLTEDMCVNLVRRSNGVYGALPEEFKGPRLVAEHIAACLTRAEDWCPGVRDEHYGLESSWSKPEMTARVLEVLSREESA